MNVPNFVLIGLVVSELQKNGKDFPWYQYMLVTDFRHGHWSRGLEGATLRPVPRGCTLASEARGGGGGGNKKG